MERKAEKREIEILINELDRRGEDTEISENKVLLKEKILEIGLLENELMNLKKAFIDDVDCCPEEEKAPLSFGTQKVEVPLLSVKIAEVSNIPDRESGLRFCLKVNGRWYIYLQ